MSDPQEKTATEYFRRREEEVRRRQRGGHEKIIRELADRLSGLQALINMAAIRCEAAADRAASDPSDAVEDFMSVLEILRPSKGEED